MAHRVCPWWLGYFLASPLRRLAEKPEQILDGLITPGTTVLDAGCAMGFFTLPAARMVGDRGRVIAVDLQEKMLNSLRRRARRAGLGDRIELRPCSANDLGLNDLAGEVDVALAFHVVHEVPDQAGFLAQIGAVLKPGRRLLVAEPKGHVTDDEYAQTEGIALRAGFTIAEHPTFKRSHATLFKKA